MALPVLLLTYNRPELTRKVLESVACSGTTKVYVANDGPKSVGDRKKVHAVREVIADYRDRFTLTTLYQNVNAGCRVAVQTGINWFFSHEDEGIVLEDDTLAHPDFFSFSSRLINHYRDDLDIWGIGGSNMMGTPLRPGIDHDFIRYPQIWGWATWKNRWVHYDSLLEHWADMGHGHTFRWKSPRDREIFQPKLESIYFRRRPDTWDYQWSWTVLKNQGFWVFPRENLVENIGFVGEATHMRNRPRWIRPLSEKHALQELHWPPKKPNLAAERAIAFYVHGVFRPVWLYRICKNMARVTSIKRLFETLKQLLAARR